MPKYIDVYNKRIFVGDKLVANMEAHENGLCPNKTTVTVVLIRNDSSGIPVIGIRSPKRLEGWHDLDGNVEPHKGLWLTRDTLMDNFSIVHTSMEVSSDFEFKNRNLKGKRCRVLSHDKRLNHYMVEFDENIGGTGADGMGKSKHCALIPGHILKQVSELVKSVKE